MITGAISDCLNVDQEKGFDFVAWQVHMTKQSVGCVVWTL